MMHGITARYCHQCERNTPHLIVENNDAGVKIYICVVHNHVTIGGQHDDAHRVEKKILLQVSVQDDPFGGAD